mmetsp:Transcript_11469/g.22847  ORF Transcript_11469/g.22847 Transcript_11469/m.22847 type:complete len:259 (+) Transcript_11469:875-1651(+)
MASISFSFSAFALALSCSPCLFFLSASTFFRRSASAFSRAALAACAALIRSSSLFFVIFSASSFLFSAALTCSSLALTASSLCFFLDSASSCHAFSCTACCSAVSCGESFTSSLAHPKTAGAILALKMLRPSPATLENRPAASDAFSLASSGMLSSSASLPPILDVAEDMILPRGESESTSTLMDSDVGVAGAEETGGLGASETGGLGASAEPSASGPSVATLDFAFTFSIVADRYLASNTLNRASSSSFPNSTQKFL